jgi:putative membrane-bound dehydrogenase-like protein
MNQFLAAFVLIATCAQLSATDANRLTYLDSSDPFYPDRNLPRLTTPQWVGESNVEAVVVLAVDDMRESKDYEKFLRPILDRLKQIDGRAPVSIMTCNADPKDRQLQSWLKEGVSLEVHTLAHPCPLLMQSNFTAAEKTVNDCIDLLNKVPNNKPVAFRMPCCDSMNSSSPRFYAEIFNRNTAAGHFLAIDSSVMNITTTNDISLPHALVIDEEGKERFRKYVPFENFGITIEDYPYPYIIGGLCWEFPGAVPSDWEAQNLHGAKNSKTVRDWEALLDATVLKQGVFNFIFHPHGWIDNAQLIEFIDYADKKYGRRVKFLNFREALERLNKNLLGDHPIRTSNGQKSGVRVVDLNNDGYMDVIVADETRRVTRLWNNTERKWTETTFPVPLVVKDSNGGHRDQTVRFGVMQDNGFATALVRTESLAGAWDFDGKSWVKNDSLMRGLTFKKHPVYTGKDGRGQGARLRDIDKSGRCSLIIAHSGENVIFSWSPERKQWVARKFGLPPGTTIADSQGRDAGLRFVDINGDGYDDVVYSNEKFFAIYTFFPAKDPLGFDVGWTREIISSHRKLPEPPPAPASTTATKPPPKNKLPAPFFSNAADELPPIVRNGQNNGVWFKYGKMWIQNEDTPVEAIRNTAGLRQVVNQYTFDELVKFGQPKPKSPKDSLASMSTLPGFKVELVASEPLVKSPVAFEWGADGKLWVVEMGDYPLGIDGKGKPGGIVRYLEDTDGDGIYDKSTVFLEGVNFPNGIYPWRKGVIVSAAPEIFYAEDTDGDGKADVHKTLFSGFNEGNQQHRANGFDYGLDGWLYGANGDSGGDITVVGALRSEIANSQSAISISGRDFRFNPDTGDFETQAGQTQFGRHRDDFGNWFGNNNATILWHYYLPIEYLSRNPHLSVGQTYRLLAQYDDGTRVFPTSKTLQRFNDPSGANHLTSGNSPTPYRANLFGPDFAHSVFISEPVHNLVHREELEADGVTFKSHRAQNEPHREFLSSKDNWFRPTQIKTGPDGALYVADMYRLVIEHPEWIPAEIQKQYDLRAGADKGRIYRVYPAKAKLAPVPNLTKLGTRGLCAILESPNGWRRDTAQRLLIERNDPKTGALLETQFIKSQQAEYWNGITGSPGKALTRGRIHALYTLHSLKSLTPALLTLALKDTHAAVREHAAHLSGFYVAQNPDAELQNAVLSLTNEPAIRVRYQLAFALGGWNDPRAGETLARIALRDAGNEAVQTAVMSSATNHVGEMLATVLATAQPPGNVVEELIALATAMNDSGAFEKALAKIVPTNGKVERWQMEALTGFLDALDRRNTSLKKFHDDASTNLKSTIGQLDSVFAQARTIANDSTADMAVRLTAVRLSGRGLANQDADIKALGGLLNGISAPELQKAALATLKRSRSPVTADAMLAGWKTYLPETRTEILNAVLTRLEWTKPLLDRLENGSIPPGQIAAPFQQKLLTHVQPAISSRAKKIFASANPDRKKLVQDYQSVASLTGNATRGATLFKQNCATCHIFKGQGNAVGPDLGALGNKTIPTLLVAILDPNQSIETRYISYTAVTKNERELTGVVSAETPTSITIKSAGGSQEIVLRNDLVSLTSSGLSLMPEGLEKVLDRQAMADLIGYLNGK